MKAMVVTDEAAGTAPDAVQAGRPHSTSVRKEFVDLEDDTLEDVGGVDLVFDLIGGDSQKRSAALVRAGGTLVTVTGPPEARPAEGLAVDFVVVSDRTHLGEIAQRVRDGRLQTNIGQIAALDHAVAAFNPPAPVKGKTVIRIRP